MVLPGTILIISADKLFKLSTVYNSTVGTGLAETLCVEINNYVSTAI